MTRKRREQNDEYLIRRVADLAQAYCALSDDASESARLLLRSLDNLPAPTTMRGHAAITAIVLKSMNVKRRNDALETRKRQETVAERVLRVLSQRHQVSHLRLNDIAREVGMSGSYLAHALKSETGKSFTHHLREVRIAASLRLLKDKTLTIKEIAYQTGFGDASAFTRSFVRVRGMPPRLWRKQRR